MEKRKRTKDIKQKTEFYILSFFMALCLKKELGWVPFLFFKRNKAGNARTIAPFYGIGGDINMNIFSLLDVP